MSEAATADWLAVIAAIAAAVAAFGAFAVAVLQWRATQRQTASSLFDRRFKVYRDLADLRGQISRGTDREEDLVLAQESFHSGRVLFSEALEPTFGRVFNLTYAMTNAKARHASDCMSGRYRVELHDEIIGLREEVLALLDSLLRLLLREMKGWRN